MSTNAETEAVEIDINDKVAADTVAAINEILPGAPEWAVSGLCSAIASMIPEDMDIETGYAFIAERLGEVVYAIQNGQRDSKFAVLCESIARQQWGALTVEVKGGIPVMIREYRKDVKL